MRPKLDEFATLKEMLFLLKKDAITESPFWILNSVILSMITNFSTVCKCKILPVKYCNCKVLCASTTSLSASFRLLKISIVEYFSSWIHSTGQCRKSDQKKRK